jgi:hypothetical protein
MIFVFQKTKIKAVVFCLKVKNVPGAGLEPARPLLATGF